MAYCNKCNAPNPEGAKFCTACGAPLEEATEQNVQSSSYYNAQKPSDTSSQGVYYQPAQGDNAQQSGYYQPTGNDYTYTQPEKPQEEKASVGLAILSFFFPVVGIILYFVMKKDRPKTAKKSLTCAIASFAISVIFSIVMTIAAGFLFSENITDDTEDEIESFVEGLLDDFDYQIDDVKQLLGYNDEKTYTNLEANLAFTAPSDDWEFVTSDTILPLAPGAEIDEDTGLVVLEQGNEELYFNALCVDRSTGANIQFLVVEPESKLISAYSAEQYIKFAVESLAQSSEGTVSELTKLTIGGEEYVRIDASYISNGSPIEQSFVGRKIGDYFFYMCISTFEGATTIDEFISLLDSAY